MSVLEEMTAVILAVPGPRAPAGEVAAWYERKARLLEHIAVDGGTDAEDAQRQAALAHRRARILLGEAA